MNSVSAGSHEQRSGARWRAHCAETMRPQRPKPISQTGWHKQAEPFWQRARWSGGSHQGSECPAGHGQCCLASRSTTGGALTPLASCTIIMLSIGDFRCCQLLSVCGPQAELGLGGGVNKILDHHDSCLWGCDKCSPHCSESMQLTVAEVMLAKK